MPNTNDVVLEYSGPDGCMYHGDRKLKTGDTVVYPLVQAVAVLQRYGAMFAGTATRLPQLEADLKVQEAEQLAAEEKAKGSATSAKKGKG